MINIDLAKVFSPYPAGRFYDDGPFSGEKFREEFLKPALQGSERVRVYLDDSEGYGSSFLEEAFGGLVRKEYFSADDLHHRLDIVTEDEILSDEIWQYIDNAAPESSH